MQKHMRILCALSAFFLVFMMGASRLDAQATAAISGTVSDTSGAVMAEANVQAKNVGTGITQTTKSDSQGRFRFPDLGIGDYEVQASKTGFTSEVRKGITLTVGSNPVVDFSLPVGQAQQTVTVEGQVSQVETQSTAVGSLVESKQIRDLPLNGRNFTQLLTLAPGVTQIAQGAPGAGSTFYGNGTNYSIAGSRPSGAAYLLDDTDIAGFWNHGTGTSGLGTTLGVESIAEFQTLTNTYSSQFGGNGAVINASSKSGTNAFHGSAYEFLRNDKLESRNFFDLQKPPYQQNQFGGSLGGAIKKDKAFFFVNYEGLRLKKTTTAIATVPDQNAHNYLLPTGPGGALVKVAPNSNPAVAAAINNTLALWPNTAFDEILSGGLPSGTGHASVLDPLIGHENYVLGRVDYTLSDKDSVFFRYVLDRSDRTFTGAPNVIPWWPELSLDRNNYATIEERRIVSARLVNLIHFSFVRPNQSASVSGSPIVSGGVASAGTVATAGTHPLQFYGTGAGREDGTINAFAGLTQLGATATLPFYLIPNKFTVGDDIIWTSGAHSIKAGGNITRLRENTWAPFQVGTVWTFSNLTTFLQGSPASVGGQVSDAQNPTADAAKDYRYIVFTPYVEDQWKISNKLTLNIGVRYSPTTKIHETRHLMYNLLDAPNGVFVPVTDATRTNPSLKNFDPRLGLAWDPFADHKTSVRASFGMFHNVIFSRDTNHWLQPPFLTATQLANQGLTYPIPFSNVPAGGGTISIPSNGTLNITNGDFYNVANTPYQMQWNFNIQRELMPSTVLSVGYVGSHNIHMFTQHDFNYPTPFIGADGNQVFATFTNNAIVPNPRLNPAYATLQLANTQAASSYNALQTSVNRRFSRGWQVQASYTFSKSIDDSSGTYGLDGGGVFLNPTNLSADRGLSNFNRTHNFRLSGVYALPFKGNQLFRGWQLTGVYTYLSGAPFTPLGAPNRAFSANNPVQARPNVIAGCNLYPDVQTISNWFNTACYSTQPIGEFGNAGRDTLIGPNLWNADAALLKDTKITRISEQFTIQFRAEFFNVLNHPSFQNPSNGANGVENLFNLSGSGVIPNASAGKITATNSQPRQIQLALKIVF
jgi:carboxypeptidase family protein/TonB-dependent receptor-like protein